MPTLSHIVGFNYNDLENKVSTLEEEVKILKEILFKYQDLFSTIEFQEKYKEEIQASKLIRTLEDID